MTKKDALALTAQIRDGLQDTLALCELIARAFDGQVWKPLKYPSWAEYCAGEFRPYSLSRDHQRVLNAALVIDEGMSASAASAATGTSDKTASRDAAARCQPTSESSEVRAVRELLRGADGRQRPRTQPRPPRRRQAEVISIDRWVTVTAALQNALQGEMTSNTVLRAKLKRMLEQALALIEEDYDEPQIP